MFKNISRPVSNSKSWCAYNGRFWQLDKNSSTIMEQVKALTYHMLDCHKYIEDEVAKTTYIKRVLSCMRKKSRDDILADAASVFPINLNDFDREPYMFNVENGTLELKTTTFHSHKPNDLLSMMANVKYDSLATCERWIQFISEIMKGDTEKARYLQKALSYALTADTSHECLFILYGSSARNGKSTVMETILTLIGDYGCTA
jgi:putative DNA primase/helicase